MTDYLKTKTNFIHGLILLEPIDLYNILNQEYGGTCVSIPQYLLLIDCRGKTSYFNGHIVTAKYMQHDEFSRFKLPNDAQLNCKKYIVVYDDSTSDLYDTKKYGGNAIECGKYLYENGSKNHVLILKGGYNLFTSIYHFLVNQKTMYMPRELENFQTYPLEVIEGFLFIGNSDHTEVPYLIKDLKIVGHICCSVDKSTFFPDIGEHLLHLKETDSVKSNLYPKFRVVVQFIDAHYDQNRRVLVYSDLGSSRSATLVLVYLMYFHSWNLDIAFKYLRSVSKRICPNKSFMEQLRQWETDLATGVALHRNSSRDSRSGGTMEDQVQRHMVELSHISLFDLVEDGEAVARRVAVAEVRKSVEEAYADEDDDKMEGGKKGGGKLARKE